MIQLTPHGSMAFQSAVLRVPKTVHLFTETGELEGYGYAPKRLVFTEFNSRGEYPELMFEFKSENQPTMVLGYFTADENGQVLFSELFEEPRKVQNQGDRIGVSIDFQFLGALGE